MRPVFTYLLLQVPGMLLLAGLLGWAVAVDFLRVATALLIFVVWVFKDVLLYPAFKHSMAPAPAVGARALVGRQAELVRPTDPRGYVRLDGELWAARSLHGDCLAAGSRVRVVSSQGLVLIVEPVWSD